MYKHKIIVLAETDHRIYERKLLHSLRKQLVNENQLGWVGIDSKFKVFVVILIL